MDRRSFLAAMLAPAVAAIPGADELAPTPSQVEGPYYPSPALRRRLYPPNPGPDLTRVGDALAEGTRVTLSGRVRSVLGEPLIGATLHIWQTCHRGRYLHPGDDWGSEIPPDPGFAYFGVVDTDERGRFSVRTVMPRRYPSGGQREWWRPPHVHVKVMTGRATRLTTQLYFDDPADPENSWKHRAVQEVDRVLGDVPRGSRAQLVVPLAVAPDPSPDPSAAAWGSPRSGSVELVVR